MNNDDNFIRNSGELSPELEARVVAWVLGEASAFEAAQLEVLCAQQPELAVFKRRLEAVHGLVGEAVKPLETPLLLSPERRAKVLAVIGGDAPTIESVVAAPAKARKQARSWRGWVLPMAACFTVMALLAAVMIPTVGAVRKTAHRSNEISERRQLEHRAMALDLPAETSEVVNSSASANYPLENKASSLGSREMNVDGYAVGSLSGSATEAPARVFFDKAMAGSGMLGVDAATPAMPPPPASPVAASKPPTAIVIAGNQPLFGVQMNSEPESGESQRQLRDQGQALAFADDMAGAKRGDLAFGDQSNARLESVAAQVRRRREFRPNPAADPFAAPAATPDSAPSVYFDGEVAKDVKKENTDALLVEAQNRLKSGDTKGARQALESYQALASNDTALDAKNSNVMVQEKDVAKLAAKGRSQYLAGDSDGAQETFRTLESVAPENAEANSFLKRIEKEKSSVAELNRSKTRSQLIEEVSNSWQRPGVYNGGTVATTRGAQAADGFAMSAPMSSPQADKLRQIIIPSVSFKDVPLSKVVSTLSTVSESYDRSEGNASGANIILLDPSAQDPHVSITLRNLSLGKILDLITDSTGYRYDVQNDVIVVRPNVQIEDLENAFFPVSRAVLQRMVGVSGEELMSRDMSSAIQSYFQKVGVDFRVAGSAVVYDGAAVIVNQTPRNIERMRNIFNRYQDAADKPDVEKLRTEISTATESVSTFSLHVSDASFRLAKAALERGQAPDPATIRPEEFYNAFDYGDPSPAAGEAVSCRVEQAAHPFLQQRNLVRIAMKVPAAGRGAGQPLRLTVMLDTSGSMEREDRAATVRAALTALTSLLGPDDRVTLVGFARTPTLLAEAVPGDQAAKIIELAARTPAEGGTNLEEALALAGKLAMRQKLATAQNRIVLLTDGAANLGDADPQALAKRVEALRQNGIAFDACGVVADGLDDSVLEALTRKGDGRYAVINSPEEADANFARQLAGAFRPAAKDVKVQVHFNPARVARYRLIGFEKHRLKTEDFRNDKIDAAELAAEEAAVAVYQVEVLPEGEGELGEVAVRFLDTRSNERVERSWTLAYSAQPAAFARATPSLQLAGSAAFLAEKLRGGALAGQVRLDEFAPVVEGLGAAYPNAPRVREFIQMFRQTRRMTGE